MKGVNEFFMDELLAAYLAGQATAEEQRVVEEWVDASPANKKQFEDFKLIWGESKALVADLPVDADAAWMRFQGLVGEGSTKNIAFRPTYSWLKIAAVLLLLAGGTWLTYRASINKSEPMVAQLAPGPAAIRPLPATVNKALKVEDKKEVISPAAPADAVTPVSPEPPVKEPAENAPVIAKKIKKDPIPADDCKSKNFVCNSTPCPIEVCIVQKSNCSNDVPYSVYNCSVIRPDESGKLCYKAMDDKLYDNCSLTVQEIRIKRLSTGETIVLNDRSRPVSAQDAFEYITGEKKGDIVAGVFHSDCNNVSKDYSLRIDNQYGNLLFR